MAKLSTLGEGLVNHLLHLWGTCDCSEWPLKSEKQTKRTQLSFVLALLFALLLFTANANAQGTNLSTNPRDWVAYGDTLLQSGNPTGALEAYNRSYALAEASHEAYVMAGLTARYLQLGNELSAVYSYAMARSYAYDWMKQDPSGGQSYTNGVNALRYMIDLYNNTLRMFTATPQTQGSLRSEALQASYTVRAVQALPSVPSAPTVSPTPPTSGPTPSSTPRNDWDPWADLPIVPRNPR